MMLTIVVDKDVVVEADTSFVNVGDKLIMLTLI